MKNIRVRFAPSPTGYLHVGGLRTALYNYLFAKRNNGKFILRIEDTDQSRYVEGAVENLINALKWSGLEFDEGPEKDGGFGPYFQSQRLDIYKKYAADLVKNKNAYYCFCSPERLTALRDEQKSQNLQAKYDKHCLSLSETEIKEKLDARIPYVIRLNIPSFEKVVFNDIIRNRVEFDTATIDDQVLIKSDGFPTYHLANVIDDHLMDISHVIRGEEWLSSTPKHVLLYNFFGWEIPQFAHLPLLLNPDKTKLSKRQGDVAVEDYRAKGYSPEALLNFVALLGWNAGDDKEFYYMDELIEKFSLERVNNSGAVFDIQKLNWLNTEHFRKLPKENLLSQLKSILADSEFNDANYSDEYLLLIIESMIERVTSVKEILEKSPYFFTDPLSYEEESKAKNWKPETPELLNELAKRFALLGKITDKHDFEKPLKELAAEKEIGAGKLIHPLRLAVSGMSTGPGVYDLLYIIGKEKTISRIGKAVKAI
ncbi:MAG: glutamate--tRNA ligase [Melioribacteraceae bacterium]|nr:glutamate--tRNA ligase [Melioribacteraceae bacterium]